MKVLFLLAGLALLAGCGGEKADFDRAMVPFDQGRMEEARESLSRFLDRHPDGRYAPEALYQRAHIELLYLDDLTSAAFDLREISRSFPRHERAFAARFELAGLQENRMGDLARARAELMRLLIDFPGHRETPRVRFRLGELAYRDLRFDEARGFFGQLGGEGGELAEKAAFRAAQSWGMEGRWAEAEAAWREFLSRFPESASRLDACMGLAEALEKEGRGEEAVGLLTPLSGEGEEGNRVAARIARIRERMAKKGQRGAAGGEER